MNSFTWRSNSFPILRGDPVVSYPKNADACNQFRLTGKNEYCRSRPDKANRTTLSAKMQSYGHQTGVSAFKDHRIGNEAKASHRDLLLKTQTYLSLDS